MQKCFVGLAVMLLSAEAAWAQLARPNESGVAMGHLHYRVQDVEANRDFWVGLGGTSVTFGRSEVVKFPDVLVFLTEGESSGGSDGSVVNHVAFRVMSLEAVEAAGYRVQRLAQFPGVASVMTPGGERIELFDNTATNLTFTVDSGETVPQVERHNRPLTIPIVAHHVHLYLPPGDELRAKEWYRSTFGATPGKRWNYDAVDLPGINLNFSGNPGERAPTRGRMLDHIGFEVTNLEAFCRRLEAQGLIFDEPYGVDENGVGRAMLTDPWGTAIELTEGLGRL